MDDKNLKRPQDAKKINLGEEFEVKYWCEKFGVSEETLRKAVNKTGVSAVAVQDYLKSRAQHS